MAKRKHITRRTDVPLGELDCPVCNRRWGVNPKCYPNRTRDKAGWLTEAVVDSQMPHDLRQLDPPPPPRARLWCGEGYL